MHSRVVFQWGECSHSPLSVTATYESVARSEKMNPDDARSFRPKIQRRIIVDFHRSGRESGDRAFFTRSVKTPFRYRKIIFPAPSVSGNRKKFTKIFRDVKIFVREIFVIIFDCRRSKGRSIFRIFSKITPVLEY